MARDLVSIIIPAYNAGEYILRSVGSALTQTYENIEIIVVDDGSTDDTVKQIEKIRDSRLRVIPTTNKGPGVARNTGIDAAKGTYIYCLDSDDEMSEDTVKRCIDEIEVKGVDIVTFDTKVVGDSEIFKPDYCRNIKNGVYKTEEYIKPDTTCVIWLYFFKASLIENLRFIEGIIHEDRAYTPVLIKRAEGIVYLNEVLHTRHIVENSIMTKEKTLYNIESKKRVIDYLEGEKIEKSFIEHLWWSMYTDILKIKDSMAKKKAYRIMEEIKTSKEINISIKQRIKMQILRYRL